MPASRPALVLSPGWNWPTFGSLAGRGAVFAGVSAAAGPGHWLAVTGAVGAGPPTLLAVLLGFLPAAAGKAAMTGTAAWCPPRRFLPTRPCAATCLSGLPAPLAPAAEEGAGRSPNDAAASSAARDIDLAAALAAVGLTGPSCSSLLSGSDARSPGGSFLSGDKQQRSRWPRLS